MNNTLIKILFLLVALCALPLQAQERKYITETDDYIIWQPGVKLTFDMFKNTAPTEKALSDMRLDNKKHLSYRRFCGVLDVPKKKSWKKGHYAEKAYFAAKFSKFQSYMAERDSFELQVAQTEWDICELATRKCRSLLDSIQIDHDSINGVHTTGVVSIYYYTVYVDGADLYYNFLSAFYNEVVKPHDSERLKEFREFINALLEETAYYATTPEEAERFLFHVPVDENLMQAKQTVGDMKQRGRNLKSGG